jgi:cytochrome c biogenesis protein CcdA
MACFLVAMLFVFSRQALMPRINYMRDAELLGTRGAAERFQRLHRWSVLINAAQGIVLIAIAATLIINS